jgi:hypothetical protein
MANKTIVFNLDIATTDYVKKVQEAEAETRRLKEERQKAGEQAGALVMLEYDLTKAYGENSEQVKQVQIQLEETRKTQVAYDAAVKVGEANLKNANKQLEDQVRYTSAAEDSYEALYRQWKNAEIALKTGAGNFRELADGTFEFTEKGKLASAEVLRLKEGVLKFNESIKDGRLNVGNYAAALDGYLSKTQQVVGSSTALGGAIGGISDAITKTSTGFELLQDGVTNLNKFIQNADSSITNFGNKAKESFNKLFSVDTEKSSNTFSTINDGAEDAITNVTGLGEAGLDTGNKIKVGTSIGANGFKTLRTALISTGLGAIVVVVGSLIGYLSQLQSVTDGVKKVFSGLTAIFKVYLQTVFDIAKAILTLDFSKAFDSFTGFFDKAGEAAGAAYDLEEAKIALENQDIKNVAALDELNDKAEESRILAEDKTKTDEERIKLIEQANEYEKQALEIQLQREEQALAIAAAEIEQANATGEATREQLLAYEQLKVKVGDIQDQIKNKEISTLAETSKLRKQFQKDNIDSEVGLLNNQLKRAQLYGGQAYSLQREIARKEYEAKKAEGNLNEKQQELLLDDLNTKIAEINKAASDERLQKERELEQLRINNIVDGQAREVAAIAFATKQKLDAIKGGSKQEKQLRLQIAEESAREILEVAQKYSQQTQQERQSILLSNQSIQQAEIDSEAAKQEEILQLQLSAINAKQKKSQEDLLFEQNAAQASLKIEEQRLQKQLELQLNATGQRIQQDKTYYDSLDKKNKEFYDGLEKDLLKSGLSQDEINKQRADIENRRRDSQAELNKQRQAAEVKTEQETQGQIEAITTAINQNRVQQTVTANNTIAQNNAKIIEDQRALQDATNDAVLQGIQSLGEVLNLSGQNQKKYALLNKTLALTELVINLQREISGYWAGVGKDTATGGFILGTASSAKATAQTIAASIRAAAGIAKISAQKFEQGGFTVGEAVKKYNPTIASSFQGGYVSTPTMWAGLGKMNLAGEAGTEYVSPNWQLKQAPALFSALENWRRTGVKPFADGGFTTSTITQPLQQNASLIESAIIKGFSFAPAPVVSVQEINDIQTRVNVIESRSAL